MPTVTGTENLMMAAATADGITTIHNAAREPHVVDLAFFLGKMGARIQGIGTDILQIEGVSELSGATHRVIPDNIEAGTYAIAVAIAGGEVELVGAAPDTIASLTSLLVKSGAEVSATARGLKVHMNGARPHASDVTTGVDFMEVHNAVDQATKEITQRYDFKGLKVSFALDQKEKKITISAPDEFKLNAMWDVLQSKMVRRQVPLKNLTPGKIESAALGGARQEIAFQDGLTADKAREIVKVLKDAKLRKVQAAIQGDTVRVSSASKTYDPPMSEQESSPGREADVGHPARGATTARATLPTPGIVGLLDIRSMSRSGSKLIERMIASDLLLESWRRGLKT